jgi:glycogen debranching enzyme, archaeal type, putative
MELDYCLSNEWLLTNGLGGYSSSTLCGINVRTYHGLLVASIYPPYGRRVILSKLEEWVSDGEQEFPMSSNSYPDVIYPNGYSYLEGSEWGSNYIRWIYKFPICSVVKTVILHRLQSALTVRYEIDDKCSVKIMPLITDRSHHLTRKSGFARFSTKGEGNELIVKENGKSLMRVWSNQRYELQQTEFWYYNFNYIKDKELGNNYLDDLFNPFSLTFTSRQFELGFGLTRSPAPSLESPPETILELIGRATLDFLVRGNRGPAIVAGYHWFGEWGRDTMISLEGTLLMNGLFNEARDILQRYIDSSFRGFLPTYFRDHDGEPSYRGVDVTLWAINALYSYYKYSGDKNFIKKNIDRLIEDLEWYLKGNGIVRMSRGLLFHSGAPLTWMDAQFDGNVVTPREGAAVEVNALLYNSLMIIDHLLKELGSEPHFVYVAEELKKSFNTYFVGEHGLYDYLDEDLRPSVEVRPNQIFAISLPFQIVRDEVARKVMEIVERELLRPYGLSTLSRSDPKYKAVYGGERRTRDQAYHNGPIWPWLLGAYVDAKARTEKDPINLKSLIAYFDPLISYAKSNRGFLPELFNDIVPYRAGGCIAQAWSVSEVFRGLSKLLAV